MVNFFEKTEFRHPSEFQSLLEKQARKQKRKSSEYLTSTESALKTSVDHIKAASTKQAIREGQEEHVAFEIVSQMVGKARKDKKTKKERTKFSSEQIMLLTQCYNAGAKDESKRFMAEMCQKEMMKDPSIGHADSVANKRILVLPSQQGHEWC